MSDGIPSPNPDFPQQIKNVTGNANVKIQNKNLFNYDYAKDFSNTIVSTYRFVKIADVKEGQNYIISNLDISDIQTETNLYIYISSAPLYSSLVERGNRICYNSKKLDRTSINLNAPTSNSYYLGIFPANITEATYNKILDKFRNAQLEQGSTATSYVPHQEQNFPLTLGDIELNKIGTAQDYFYKKNGKWYKHEELSSVVFDGTENWANYGSSYDGRFYCTTKHFGDDVGFLNSSKFKCTHFTPSYGTTIVNGIAGTKYATYIKPNIDGVVDATTFKTWLSTHNVTVKCPLVAATNTEITDTTLIEQLNNIQNATSYNDITIISSESDELGFDMNVVAVADANKVIDSLDTRLSALEGNTNQTRSLEVDTKNITKETTDAESEVK